MEEITKQFIDAVGAGNVQIRKLARHYGISPLFSGLHPSARDLAYEGTFDECTEYVRKCNRRLFLAVVLIGLVLLAPWPSSGRSLIVPSEPVYESAGKIQAIVLHEASFSSTTSITTTEGVFQVAGAVSASIGDEAKVKRWMTGSVQHAELCIESKFKPSCSALR